MKKLLLFILLSLVSYTVSAATFTIDVDNAENVEVGYNKPMWGGLYYQFFPYSLQNGATTITTDAETSFLCRVPDGSLAVIDLITKNGVPVTDYDNITIEDGMNIVIRTHVEDGAATCNVNCDDYSQVQISVNGNLVTLTSNTQQIDFTRGNVIEISHVDNTKKLAEVKLNGVIQPAGYGDSYILTNVADGDIIDIRANFAEYDVTFSFNNDRARQYINRVEVNGTEVPDYTSGLKVEEDANVSLKINQEISNVEVRANGNILSINPFFKDMTFYVTEDTNVEVTALEAPEPEKIIANVNVDKAENVNLYYVKAGIIPIYNTNVYFELTDGDNPVEIPEGVSVIYAEPATNCLLTDVKRNNEDVAIDPMKGNYAFDVENGMNIVITSKALEASASFTLICSDPSKITLQLGDTPYELTEETEQIIKFIPETQSSVKIEAVSDETPVKAVLHNDNNVEMQGTGFGGSPYYHISDLKDNDKIEVTLPAVYNVTFSYGEQAREDYIEDVVLGDRIIDNYKEGFKAPEDATVSIHVVSTITDQKIYINDILQKPNEYSFVTFTVTADTEVRVEADIPSSFTFICADPSKVNLKLDQKTYELTDMQEQEIQFNSDTQTDITIEAADSDMPIKEVLHNGQAVVILTDNSDNAPYYLISDVKDKDRIEVLLPNMYNVTFSYDEGVREDYIKRVVLNDKDRDNYKDGLNAPEDAMVSLYVLPDVTDHKISVNGSEQKPDKDSCISFAVKGHTEVKIELDTSSLKVFGIEDGKMVNVYDLNGILIKEKINSAELKNLDAGLYIIDGKKVLLTK